MKNHVLDERGNDAAGGYSVRCKVSKRRRLRCGNCNLALHTFELMIVYVNASGDNAHVWPLRMRSICVREAGQ